MKLTWLSESQKEKETMPIIIHNTLEKAAVVYLRKTKHLHYYQSHHCTELCETLNSETTHPPTNLYVHMAKVVFLRQESK